MSSRLIGANALFLHIPKTGGTWIEHALVRSRVAIEPAGVINGVTFRHPVLPHLTQRYDFTFAFVRHPLGWYESWWKFQAGLWREFEPGVWHPQRVLEPCRSDVFSEFIRKCIELEPGYVSRMYEWYLGPPGQQFVDFVGRYEHLIHDLPLILTRLGQPFDEEALRGQGRVNESLRLRGEPRWDPRLRRQILALEAPAIRRFYADQEAGRPTMRRGLGVGRWFSHPWRPSVGVGRWRQGRTGAGGSRAAE